MSIMKRAAIFCRAAHQAVGQRRKYTEEPYYLHPYAVANILGNAGVGTPEILAAAYLHDTLEDTGVTYIDIFDEFGPVVADLVHELTDQYADPAIGNRRKRKALERGRLMVISSHAATIKYADLIHNTVSVAEHDADFAKVYLSEKRDILNVMTQGDQHMWRKAWAAMVEAESSLGAKR